MQARISLKKSLPGRGRRSTAAPKVSTATENLFFRPAPLALAMALAVGGAGYWPQAVQAQAASRIQIAAQPLGSALHELARQAGLQLTATPDLLAGKTAPAVSGTLTAQQALNQLLAGSGLVANMNGNAVVIRPAPTKTPAPTGSAVNALPEVVVTAALDNSGTTEGTGSYTQTGPSGAATGLGLSLRETPQSVTVMTRQRMDDFKLETLTDVMEQTPGITVVRQGSHVGFQARGASVNLQTDGSRQRSSGYSYFTSTSFSLDNLIDIDRIEVLKGSNGLIAGQGSTGGTVNLIRKRPTREFQARAEASAGSWSNYGVQADISGPLNDSGTLRGRLAATLSDGKGFRDDEESKGRALFGTVELDLTPDTTLGAGLTYRQREERAISLWSSIPIYENDVYVGTRPRSTNMGGALSGYKQDSLNAFVRLEHRFANDWTSKVQVAHENIEIPEMLLYDAGEDITQATRYLDTKNKTSSLIIDVKGPLHLWGREHELLLGAGMYDNQSTFDSNNFGASKHDREQAYGYAAGHFCLAEPLKLITGLRVTRYKASDLTLYGSGGYNESGVLTPYAGLVLDVTRDISLYGSYASIFTPQTAQDEQGRTLDPQEGLSYELGTKGEFFDGRLNASIAHFWMRNDNVAEQTGGKTPGGADAYRAVMGASRRGYELELSGEVAHNWQMQGGYTMNSSSLSSASRYPKHQFKLGTTYRFSDATLQGLSAGIATRWQSKTSVTVASNGRSIEQPAYWLLDAMLRYQINDQLSVSANINNVLDKKYFSDVANASGYGLGYTWGTPRSFDIGVRYDF